MLTLYLGIFFRWCFFIIYFVVLLPFEKELAGNTERFRGEGSFENGWILAEETSFFSLSSQKMI